METLKVLIIIVSFLSGYCYADPSNVVYNNGPVGSSGEGVAMERLRSTEKELERMSLERNIAVKEMNFRIERDENRTPTWVWFTIGVVAGGAAGYLGGKALSK